MAFDQFANRIGYCRDRTAAIELVTEPLDARRNQKANSQGVWVVACRLLRNYCQGGGGRDLL